MYLLVRHAIWDNKHKKFSNRQTLTNLYRSFFPNMQTIPFDVIITDLVRFVIRCTHLVIKNRSSTGNTNPGALANYVLMKPKTERSFRCRGSTLIFMLIIMACMFNRIRKSGEDVQNRDIMAKDEPGTLAAHHRPTTFQKLPPTTYTS